MLHIIGRFILHLFSAPGIVLAATFALALLYRKTRWYWLPKTMLSTSIAAAALVMAAAFTREAFDVASGQTTFKAVSDYVSWVAGCGLTPWALQRIVGWAVNDYKLSFVSRADVKLP